MKPPCRLKIKNPAGSRSSVPSCFSFQEVASPGDHNSTSGTKGQFTSYPMLHTSTLLGLKHLSCYTVGAQFSLPLQESTFDKYLIRCSFYCQWAFIASEHLRCLQFEIMTKCIFVIIHIYPCLVDNSQEVCSLPHYRNKGGVWGAGGQEEQREVKLHSECNV